LNHEQHQLEITKPECAIRFLQFGHTDKRLLPIGTNWNIAALGGLIRSLARL